MKCHDLEISPTQLPIYLEDPKNFISIKFPLSLIEQLSLNFDSLKFSMIDFSWLKTVNFKEKPSKFPNFPLCLNKTRNTILYPSMIEFDSLQITINVRQREFQALLLWIHSDTQLRLFKRVGQVEQVPWIILLLPGLIRTLKREFEWYATWKSILNFHSHVCMLLQLIGGLVGISAFHFWDVLVVVFIAI